MCGCEEVGAPAIQTHQQTAEEAANYGQLRLALRGPPRSQALGRVGVGGTEPDPKDEREGSSRSSDPGGAVDLRSRSPFPISCVARPNSGAMNKNTESHCAAKPRVSRACAPCENSGDRSRPRPIAESRLPAAAPFIRCLVTRLIRPTTRSRQKRSRRRRRSARPRWVRMDRAVDRFNPPGLARPRNRNSKIPVASPVKNAFNLGERPRKSAHRQADEDRRPASRAEQQGLASGHGCKASSYRSRAVQVEPVVMAHQEPLSRRVPETIYFLGVFPNRRIRPQSTPPNRPRRRSPRVFAEMLGGVSPRPRPEMAETARGPKA